MNNRTHRSGNAASAFTRTDLLVTIIIAGVIGALSVQGARVFKEKGLRARCKDNLGKIGNALHLYADGNYGKLPDCSRANRIFSGRGWPWDLNTNLVADLQNRGVTRANFCCPANPLLGDKYHWNFPQYDKSRSVRIVGYSFLLNGIGAMPENLQRTNLFGGGSILPSQTELVTDAVVCSGGTLNNTMNASVANRSDYTQVTGLWTDRTSHLRGLFQGIRPAGGNIAFEDQHVEWRDFHKMKHRFATGNIIWDF